MLEQWIEKCPRVGGKNVLYSACRSCEAFVKVDCIYIVCGYKGYAKRRFIYREY
ncbi:hypothetical protein [Methanohalophilus sp.]